MKFIYILLLIFICNFILPACAFDVPLSRAISDAKFFNNTLYLNLSWHEIYDADSNKLLYSDYKNWIQDFTFDNSNSLIVIKNGKLIRILNSAKEETLYNLNPSLINNQHTKYHLEQIGDLIVIGWNKDQLITYPEIDNNSFGFTPDTVKKVNNSLYFVFNNGASKYLIQSLNGTTQTIEPIYEKAYNSQRIASINFDKENQCLYFITYIQSIASSLYDVTIIARKNLQTGILERVFNNRTSEAPFYLFIADITSASLGSIYLTRKSSNDTQTILYEYNIANLSFTKVYESKASSIPGYINEYKQTLFSEDGSRYAVVFGKEVITGITNEL